MFPDEEEKEEERPPVDGAREYVGVFDVEAALAAQRGRCFYCWSVLTERTWTVDRKDNFRDHWRDNFVLSCLPCNTSKSNSFHEHFFESQKFQRLAHIQPSIHVIDHAHKEIFHDLKSAMIGGPSIVFHRYHEAGKTRIRRVCYNPATKTWGPLPDGKVVRRIVGYDAASLYLWCVGEEMPCGVLTYDLPSLYLTQVLAEVQGKRFFGFVQVDIHVPEHLRDHFSEMPRSSRTPRVL